MTEEQFDLLQKEILRIKNRIENTLNDEEPTNEILELELNIVKNNLNDLIDLFK